MFKRLDVRFNPHVQAILERIQSSQIIFSDETSARVKGKNEWEWAFKMMR